MKSKLLNILLSLWILWSGFLVCNVYGEQKKLPELNAKVLQFAEDHIGTQVGNGECWTLAAEALGHAGAQRPGRDGVPVSIFGKKLDPEVAIQPGDVVQFEKAKFVHKTKNRWSSSTMPHHTAIVAEVNGKNITLLHQNFGGKKIVGKKTINLDEQTEGTVEFFRPQPKKEK
jgi:hypothetical protein